MSAPGLGAKSWVGWGEEGTWGNAAARSAFYKMAGGESLQLKKEYIKDPSLSGASVEAIIPSVSHISGDLPLPMRYEGLGLILKHLLGSVSSAVEGTGNKHTFVPADDLPTGLSVEIFRDVPSTDAYVGVGCKLTKGAFSISRDKPVMLSVGFHGKSESLLTKSSPTFPTAALILPTQLVLTTATFTGAVDIKTAGFEIVNPLVEDSFDLAANGALKEQQRSAKRGVTGTIEGEASEAAQYTDWTGGVEGQLIWTFTGAVIGVGPTTYEMVVTMNCLFTGRAPQVTDAGPVKLSTAFECFKSGSTPDMKIELTNTIVSV